MGQWKFRTAGTAKALEYAAEFLKEAGWIYDANAKYLLLPVPTTQDHRENLRCDTVLIGGNLDTSLYGDRKCVDLLQDPFYLAENASITAYCAVRYAEEKLPVILAGCPVLIIGWGRIGKCLGQLLRNMGACVTVFARKPEDRATLTSLGYSVTSIFDDIQHFRVIFNTAPTPMLSEYLLRPDQIKIDLASVKGIAGDDVVWARGLPGKDAPESSGRLIAATIDRLRKEGSL
ncbi:MAG: hypothetical protein IKU57_00965 [Oscillospiraceae bacterium]|nr:hypothetical protein [Oscillospiraceae bacterium]